MGATRDITVPVGARSFQGQRAGVVTRTAANVVDAGIAIAVVVSGYVGWSAVRFLLRPAAFTFPAPPVPVLFACWAGVLFLYFTASWATIGRTYGDHLLGLRVVNYQGAQLRWAGAVVRSAFCVVLPIGLYWALVSSSNRSLQDTVLRTSVLYDWAEGRHVPAQSIPVPDSSQLLPTPRSQSPDVGTPPTRSLPKRPAGEGESPNGT